MNTQKPQTLFLSEPEAPFWQDKATPWRRSSAAGEPHVATSPAPQTPQQTPTHHGSDKRRVTQVSGYLLPEEWAEVERLRGKGQNLKRGTVVTKLIRLGLAVALDKEHATMLEPRIEQTLTRLHEAFVNRFMRVIAETYYVAKAGDMKLTDLMSLAYGSNTVEFHQRLADADKEARLSLTRHTAKEQHTSGNDMGEEPHTREE